jgi:hypothetical protein
MHAAAWAASDPRCNPQFSRRWTGPPPLKRRSPALVATSNRANVKHIGNGNAQSNTIAAHAAQRAVAHAAKRVGRLQHQARLLSGIGKHDTARRLTLIAETIRAEVLA